MYRCVVDVARRLSEWVFRLSSRFGKDGVAMFDKELYRDILCVHVGHFLLDVVVSHDSRREHHGQVLRGHLMDDVRT